MTAACDLDLVESLAAHIDAQRGDVLDLDAAFALRPEELQLAGELLAQLRAEDQVRCTECRVPFYSRWPTKTCSATCAFAKQRRLQAERHAQRKGAPRA